MQQPDVYERGPLVIARFERTGVVLDATSGTIHELFGAAITALDVLHDRTTTLPRDRRDAERARAALPVVRRCVFGELPLAPGRSAGIDDERGRPLLRTYAAPTAWAAALRRPTGGTVIAGLAISTPAGAWIVSGALSTLQRMRAALEPHANETPMPELTIERGPDDASAFVQVRGRPPVPIVEHWSVGESRDESLVLLRVHEAAALMRVLCALGSRPSVAELRMLALACVRTQHFCAKIPDDDRVLASAMHDHLELDR